VDNNLEYLDGLFMTAMQKAEGINNLFDAFFGFLERKSDFYGDPKRSKDFVDENYSKYLNKYKEKQEKEAKKKKKAEDDKKKLEEEAKKKVEPAVREITAEEFERRKKLEAEGKSDEPIVEKVEDKSSPAEEKKEEKEENKLKEGTVRPGALNGGSTDKYIWTQPLIQEIAVTIPVDSNLKGKDITVKYDAKKLFVAIKGQSEPVIEGEFYSHINADTFVWTLEEVYGKGKVITINFDKLDQMKWWDCLIKGHQPIDTTKINPEPSKLSDLDGEMRGTVEKMMYDQRQKAQGLPTSDEQPKYDMLKKFQEKHPEMDFSKANMSGFGGQPTNWSGK